MDSVIFAAQVHCHLDHDDPVTHVLLITRFSVVSLWLLMLVAGLWYKEVYLLFLSLALGVDNYLNELLSDVMIKQPAPSIPCNYDQPALSVPWDPMEVYGMPSALVEHVYLFVTVALTYALLWRVRLSLLSFFAMYGYAALTCAAQVVLRFNTPWQVIVGAAVGTVYGLLYQLFIYYVLSPYFTWIVSTSVFHYLEYRDRMCSVTSRFIMQGNLSDARSYYHEVIWPLFLHIATPYLNAGTPLDLVSIEQQLDTCLKELYTDRDKYNKLLDELYTHRSIPRTAATKIT